MNMLEEYLKFEKNNITLFSKQVLSTDFYEEETFNKLLNTYIENRYYNFYSDEDTPFEERIFNHLRKTVMKLSDGADEASKNRLVEMFTIFNYVLCLDGVKTITNKTLVKIVSEYHKNLYNLDDVTLFKEELSKLLKNIDDKRKKFFDYFKTEDFGIKKYGTTKDNLFDVELTHNLRFPKLYSEFAIDKVFNSGVIKEDKLLVEYYLLTSIIINDLRSCIFDRYYLIDFETSLFEDKARFEKLINIAKDDCFKGQTVFKIKYEDFAKYGNNVKDMIRDGYMFALKIDDNIEKHDFVLFDIFSYIIVNNNSKYLKEDNEKIISIYD